MRFMHLRPLRVSRFGHTSEAIFGLLRDATP